MDVVVRAERALVGGRIRAASVGVVDGVIAAVGPVDSDVTADEDVRVPPSAVLLPGFVDTHVHVNAPGTDWEGFATATAAAAAGGITTLVDMPLDSDPVTTTVDALDVKKAAARGNCAVAVDFWVGIVPANVDDLDGLAAAGVRGFTCFLTDSGNPNFPHLSRAEFRRAAAHVARLDAAEEQAVALVLDTARETGARVHVVHVSSARVLPLIAAAKQAAVAVTAETCPHYLTFAAETIPDGGTEYAACPPIRGEDNRRLLWDGLRQGTLDMVVSDHSPCAPALKAGGDFGAAFGGISSLQTRSPGGVDAGSAARLRTARPVPLDGRAPRGTGRVHRPWSDRRRHAGRPVLLRSRRRADRPCRHAGTSARDHALRRRRTARQGMTDLGGGTPCLRRRADAAACMKILILNLNTSESMTAQIAATCRRSV